MSTADLDPDVRRRLPSFRRALCHASVELSRDLPWIGAKDPWAVLVSEVMLQQTSTARVIEPWTRFLRSFPTVAACAEANLADVLREWKGLGYPRRAKSLHDAAVAIVEGYGGAVPTSVQDLLGLPGVGAYTAHAVASFAFAQHVAVLDTNVGRVLARAIANRTLRQREAQAIATALLPDDGAAAFNQAMIDLGAQMCTTAPRCGACPLRAKCRWRSEGGEDPAPRSAAVSRPQGAYAGSDRQVRGRLLAALAQGPLTRLRLGRELSDVDAVRLDRLVGALSDEGLVERRANRVALHGDERGRR